MKRHFVIAALFAVAALTTAAAQFRVPGQDVKGPEVHPDYGIPPNAPSQKPAFAGQTDAPEAKTKAALQVTTVAEGLVTPWALEFLPDGRMLVTEKGNQQNPAKLRIVTADGKLSEPVAGLPAVDSRGQGGLLDVALAPDFAKTRMIYWSYSEPRQNNENNTAVARPRHARGRRRAARGQHAGDLPPGAVDGLDAALRQPPRVEPRRHAVCDDGRPLDHAGPHAGTEPRRADRQDRAHQRRRQHPEGQSVRRQAGRASRDLVLRKGQDYGWPTIAYGIEYQGGTITGGIQQKEGMQQPIYYWDPNIAPSGMAFYTADLIPEWKGNVFIGGLAGRALVRLVVDAQGKVTGEERLLRDMQPRERIRDIQQGPDGALYLVTDGPKGRIVRVGPQK
jgi:glucose/arabinose dehydrogenase